MDFDFEQMLEEPFKKSPKLTTGKLIQSQMAIQHEDQHSHKDSQSFRESMDYHRSDHDEYKNGHRSGHDEYRNGHDRYHDSHYRDSRSRGRDDRERDYYNRDYYSDGSTRDGKRYRSRSPRERHYDISRSPREYNRYNERYSSRRYDRDYDSRDSRKSRDYSPESSRYSRKDRYYDRRDSFENQSLKSQSPPPITNSTRDKRTVFCMQLAARLTNKELYEFLRHCGKIVEAKIIQDKHTRKSKGVAYVEFQTEQGATKALELSGQYLLGIPILIHTSESEKNRIGLDINDFVQKKPPPGIASKKLFVSNLPLDLTENDIRDLFEKFGELDAISLHIDSITGKSKGYCVLDAREAVKHMHNYEIGGKMLTIGAVMEKDAKVKQMGIGVLEEDRSISLNSSSRVELMAKLARDDVRTTSSRQNNSTTSSTTMNKESCCVVLKNMFDPDEETEEDWEKDLAEDVKIECSKYGRVRHIAIDKHSQGHVFLKFDGVGAARKAVESLNGRFFGGKRVVANMIAEVVYYASYPAAATK